MPNNKKSRKKNASGVTQGDTQARRSDLRGPSPQRSVAQSQEGRPQANLGGRADERPTQRSPPRRQEPIIRGATSRLQREVATEQTASESPPRFGDAQWGIGDTRQAEGTGKASTTSWESSSDGSITSSCLQSVDSVQSALEDILFTDYTSITGHVTISGRLPSDRSSLLKNEDEYGAEQLPTARAGGREEDMSLIKVVASNRATADQKLLFKQKVRANDTVFNTRICKALETYGAVSAMAEIVQLKLSIAIQAVDRLAKSFVRLGRCPGCRNSKCKRSVPVQYVAHPYQRTDLIDKVADNLTSFREHTQFQGELSKAAFLVQVNDRMSDYHSHAMYDRSIQLRLALFRDGVFKELRWTAQEVDFIEGHDDLLKDCAEAVKVGAPETGKCGPAFSTNRTRAVASSDSPSAYPPDASPAMKQRIDRAAESVLRCVVESGRSSRSTPVGSPTQVVEFNCDGVVVTSVRGARAAAANLGLPSSATASSTNPRDSFNATQELRRMTEKVRPQNASETKQKEDLLTATSEEKLGIPDVEKMHRSLLEKWVRQPATAPQVLRDQVLPKERAYLAYRLDLERENSKRQITRDR